MLENGVIRQTYSLNWEIGVRISATATEPGQVLRHEMLREAKCVAISRDRDHCSPKLTGLEIVIRILR
jgi:hypothetical protein